MVYLKCDKKTRQTKFFKYLKKNYFLYVVKVKKAALCKKIIKNNK